MQNSGLEIVPGLTHPLIVALNLVKFIKHDEIIRYASKFIPTYKTQI